MPVCPVCRAQSFSVLASAQQLRDECQQRERFVQQRLTREPRPGELKDLTDFFHTEDADLLSCAGCGLLVRAEHERPPAREYAEEEYDANALARQFPRFVRAFRERDQPFRSLLPEGARVLEIGSHIGAFLQVAGEWGWHAEGVDPGKDSGDFARSRGFTVHAGTIEECEFAGEQCDGVFIWNCFDQIENPEPTLRACRRLLRKDGLLAVRTPDGQFYSLCEGLLRNAEVTSDSKEFVLRTMGYNNLLGFPYFYGYSRGTLQRLIEQYGFWFAGAQPSELLAFPLPEEPGWVQREESRVSAELRLLENSVLVDNSGLSIGPWTEAWFRAS
jgi:2-polyprenyl-3-methyl-5-hydroxy-6-metoxy-1,4-benzoquinol methylase